MLVKILGTRGNIDVSAPQHAKHSGILIDGKIMLDIGEREYLSYRPAAVFITHLHEDHAFFVKEVGGEINVPVLVPEAYGSGDIFEMITNTVEIEGYTVTPLPVMHSKHVRCVGYMVEKDNKRIFYSGDVAEFDTRMLIKYGKIDAVITEASFIRKGGMIRDKESWPHGHLGVPDLVELFSRYTRRIIFTHFGSWFVNDPEQGSMKIKSMGTGMLRLDVATDGIAYEV